MSPNLENDIFTRFPSLFEGEDGSVSCSVIEVGDGWGSILTDFLNDLDAYLTSTKNPDLDASEFRITEIKEKYGALRIYTNITDDHIFNMTEKASEVSLGICELSGHAGELHGKFGVLKTLAPDVGAQYGYSPVE